MTIVEATAKIKSNLHIMDTSRDMLISDILQNILNYCNLAEIPEELETFICAKVKRVMDYEAEFGSGNTIDVVSQTEGNCSWTFSTDENNTIDSVYGFSKSDFSRLKLFRKTRK